MNIERLKILLKENAEWLKDNCESSYARGKAEAYENVLAWIEEDEKDG